MFKKFNKFDFVSHHPFYGILLWNEDDRMYNLWFPFAFDDLESAMVESRVHNGVVVHWSWPSALDSAFLLRVVDSDLSF